MTPAEQLRRIRIDGLVYSSSRPGYPSQNVDCAAVESWVTGVRRSGIQRVCCLLTERELGYYRLDLLSCYRRAFGTPRVLQAPIQDCCLAPRQVVRDIMRFLDRAAAFSEKTVVHCAAGLGRTGQILAAWLVHHDGLDPQNALRELEARGYAPREAIACGNASREELADLLTSAA